VSEWAGLPEPPEGSRPRALSPELERRVRRLRARLILVPFSFPGWIRLRRTHPAAAERLFLEVLLNIAQSLVAALVVLLFVLLVAFREQIIASLARWVVDQGIVR
jgi:hypothetical protein